MHIPRQRTEDHGILALALLNMFDIVEGWLGRVFTPVVRSFFVPIAGAEARQVFYDNFDDVQSLIGRTALRLISLIIFPVTAMLVLAHYVPEAQGIGFLVIIPVIALYWGIQPASDPGSP